MVSPHHRPGCARLGMMRLNAARLNVFESWMGALIDSTTWRDLRIDGASISHMLNEQVDTAEFRTRGFMPVAGQAIQIFNGATDADHQIFGGRIIETTSLYEKKPANVAYDIHCIDPTWLLNRRKVLAYYVNQSATAIAIDLVTRFARGVTAYNVIAGLPIVDALTFTNESLADCLSAVCQRIGGSWYVDYSGDLHLFLDEGVTAYSISDANPRGSADHQLAEDLSQVVTRVIGRGGGGTAAIDIAPGMTEFPVDEGDQQTWYSTSGGLVETPGAQIISYTGVKGRGGTGALIGTGNTPTSALKVSPRSGTGMASGAYKYACTFGNATGESTPGPSTAVNIGQTAPTLRNVNARSSGFVGSGSGMTPGGVYSWRVALMYSGGGYALGTVTPAYVVDNKQWELDLGYPTTDPVTGYQYYPNLTDGGLAEIIWTNIYRQTNMASPPVYYLERQYSGVVIPPSGWVIATSGMTDAQLVNGPTYPTGPIAQFNSAIVYAPMPTPPTGFTALHLYRTAVNQTQLKRLATVDPATHYVDTIPDASLGANIPITDTSGVIANSQANIPVGSTSILVTSTDAFEVDGGASGGWARIGDITIKYAGLSGGNTLTGVPATGAGSLTASVRYGSLILIQPRLIGVPASGTGAVIRAIRKGDTVTIRLELQDDNAAMAMADRFAAPGQTVHVADGIIEDVISDSRYGLAELADQMQAFLTERKDPHLTVTFTSRDPSLEVGRKITINLSTPPINGTFRIQRVTFSEIAITGGLARLQPLRRVEATNKLFTITDLLRQLRGRESGVPA